VDATVNMSLDTDGLEIIDPPEHPDIKHQIHLPKPMVPDGPKDGACLSGTWKAIQKSSSQVPVPGHRQQTFQWAKGYYKTRINTVPSEDLKDLQLTVADELLFNENPEHDLQDLRETVGRWWRALYSQWYSSHLAVGLG
jgi:hypothetical protein